MSFKLTQAVIDDVDTKLSLSEWGVLVVLSRHADDDGGNCYPSLDTLVQKSHACIDTVRAALKGLVKKGLITYTQEPGMKRKYTLAVPKGVGNLEGVGKVQGVGDFQGVPKTTGVGKVQPLPLENSNPSPRKNPTRREQEEIKEETTTDIRPKLSDTAETVEDFGINPFLDDVQEPEIPQTKKLFGDATPVQKIVDLYNEILGDKLPRVIRITPARAQAVRARWHDLIKDTDSKSVAEGLDNFRDYFILVSKTRFLMEGSKAKGHENWRADFDFLMRQKTYIKLLERSF